MAITLKSKHKIRTNVQNNRQLKDTLPYQDFIELHTDFVREKQLENLSERTISDHKMFFGYFTKWLLQSNWFEPDQCISKSVFLDYKEYMMHEKKYASCTINQRLRLIKTYINWLIKHGHITMNYNNFIKLVKVSDNRVQPLSIKLLATIGNETYARFRDTASH